MFLKKTGGKTEVVNEPVASTLEVPDNRRQIEEAGRIAEKLGTSRAPVLVAKMELWLAENKIPVYDPVAVAQYMHKQYPRGWTWYPMTEVIGHTIREITKSETFGADWDNIQYPLELPLEALLLLEAATDACPGTLGYVASPRLGISGDPFLALVVPPLRAWIVAGWDEPGFEVKLRQPRVRRE